MPPSPSLSKAATSPAPSHSAAPRVPNVVVVVAAAVVEGAVVVVVAVRDGLSAWAVRRDGRCDGEASSSSSKQTLALSTALATGRSSRC